MSTSTAPAAALFPSWRRAVVAEHEEAYEHAPLDAAVRLCQTCDAALLRRAGEKMGDFKRRRFCSDACFRGPASWPRRFWSKVDKSSDCWLWLGSKDKDGYGKFQIPEVDDAGHSRQRHVRAHHAAWELTHGAKAAAELLRHSCDTPACIRPNHLIPGSTAENVADRVARGRSAKHGPTRFGAGEAHFKARLGADQVRQIRERRRAGESVATLARSFAVGRSAVEAIIHGRTWKSVQ